MPRNPLFSTYRAGENRVTSSMLAVFERLDSAILERLLQAASGESTLSLVSFANQPPGRGASVPDAEISGSFHYLFEVKTDRDALRKPQVVEHLKNLQGSFDHERLFVVTPDEDVPRPIAELGDPRLVWFNFRDLSQAIDRLLAEPRELIAEQSRFLLRELQALFTHDGLLEQERDTVVVAARDAYSEYKRIFAYVCQADRAFRPGVRRMGFYAGGQIQPEIPKILHREDNVIFSLDEAKARASSDREPDGTIAGLIERLLAAGEPRTMGKPYQVFLLSGPEDELTLKMPAPVRNTAVDRNGKPSAWTQGQRYTRSDLLERGPKTTGQLEEWGG